MQRREFLQSSALGPALTYGAATSVITGFVYGAVGGDRRCDIGECAIWKYYPSSGDGPSEMVADGDSLYVGTASGAVTALEATTGNRRWRTGLGGERIRSPTVASGTVIAVGSEVVHAVDAVSGERKWSHRTEDPIYATPAVGGDTVFVGDAGGTVHALELATGRRRWQSEESGVINSTTSSGGSLYVTDRAGRVHSLERETGTELWSRRVGTFAGVGSVVEDRLYVGGADDRGGSLTAFDAATGSVLWRFRADEGIQGPPKTSRGTVYVADWGNVGTGDSDGSRLYAIDANDGTERARHEVVQFEHVPTPQVTIKGIGAAFLPPGSGTDRAVVYWSGYDRVYRFDENLEVTNTTQSGLGFGRLSLSNGMLFGGVGSGAIFAFDSLRQ
jgi:outer membrane protein assembly factor BamB